MTERAISYLLLLAATVAVLLIVIIQPHNTAIEKKKILRTHNSFLADSCTASGMGMTCDEYAAMMATKAACSNNGGMWNEVTCIYPTATDETKCTNAGYIWVKGLNGGCHFNNNSSGGSSGSPAAIGGVSANEKLNERIESQCLAHVANSGYKETLLKEGLFEIIRIYATNACTLAYFATNGKYSSNQDLFLIPRLIMNDEAKMQE